VRVTRKEDGVVDVVLVYVIEDALAIGTISVPGIKVD
jgi:hypothetical protein